MIGKNWQNPAIEISHGNGQSWWKLLQFRKPGRSASYAEKLIVIKKRQQHQHQKTLEGPLETITPRELY